MNDDIKRLLQKCQDANPGKFKVKMYSRSNFNAVSNSLGGQTAMTTGVSLLHTQNFNEVKDPQTGEKVFKKDERLFFVVTPLSVVFPVELGMQSYY